MAVNGGENVEQCMFVLDELDDLVKNGRRSWVRTDMVSVNQKELTDRVMLLRGGLPDAVKQAADIVREEASIIDNAKAAAEVSIAEAKAEAQRIVADAQAQLKQLEQQIKQANDETARIQKDNERLIQEGARKAQEEANGIIAKANEEAARLVNLGEQRAMELVHDEAVYHRAEVAARELMESANTEADQLRQKTFSYLDGVMSQMEEYAGNLMADIHDQRDSLNSRKR